MARFIIPLAIFLSLLTLPSSPYGAERVPLTITVTLDAAQAEKVKAIKRKYAQLRKNLTVQMRALKIKEAEEIETALAPKKP